MNVRFGDELFHHFPPKHRRALDETRRRIDGEGHIVLLKDRVGMIEIVIVAVVKRYGGEPSAILRSGFHALDHLIHGHDFCAFGLQRDKNLIKKMRRDRQ